MYKIPEEYYLRIHHVRPRFKNDLENVLVFVADSIARMPRKDSEIFANILNDEIYQYPGNIVKAEKTINNWRTEISALFGFIESEDNESWPGLRAKELSANQDLIEFFKTFLFSFQYPGAHLKVDAIQELIEHGVCFKPAKFILNLLYTREKTEGRSRAYITKAEACHCIFNDLRCTRDNESPEKTWSRINQNRRLNVDYDMKGDVIRYAGDIIDYMEIADLLITHNGKEYYLNSKSNAAIQVFINSKDYFNGYDPFIRRKLATYDEINTQKNLWFHWVNRDLGFSDFSTEVTAYIPVGVFTQDEIKGLCSFENKDKESGSSERITTHDIGVAGEALIFGHECQSLKNKGRSDLVHLVKKIPNEYAIGYDINSTDEYGTKKCIEVKTTISSKPLTFTKITLTNNEWMAANTYKENYYVYRLMLSSHGESKLFIIRNPIKLYKEDKISMIPTSNGIDLVFNEEECGNYEDLLEWKND